MSNWVKISDAHQGGYVNLDLCTSLVPTEITSGSWVLAAHFPDGQGYLDLGPFASLAAGDDAAKALINGYDGP